MASRTNDSSLNGAPSKKGKITPKSVVAKPTATTRMLEAMLEPAAAPKRRKATKTAKAMRGQKQAHNETMWTRVVKENIRNSAVGSLSDLVSKTKSFVSKPKERKKRENVAPTKQLKTKSSSRSAFPSNTKIPVPNRYQPKTRLEAKNGINQLALRIGGGASTAKRARPVASSVSSSSLMPRIGMEQKEKEKEHNDAYHKTVTVNEIPEQHASNGVTGKDCDLNGKISSKVPMALGDSKDKEPTHISELPNSRTIQKLLDRPDIDFKSLARTPRATMDVPAEPRKRAANNDNFVRLNMRNSAGACRGARNKKRKRFQFSRSNAPMDVSISPNEQDADDVPTKKAVKKKKPVANSGVDPLDDYVDGVFHSGTDSKPRKSTSQTPNCARHQRPCKLLTVKKNTTGNKGRQFYVCSMPRGEQCDHFEWAEDTKEAAKMALLKNSSYSGFVARQVASYAERFRALTVPELKEEAKRRNLGTSGKRQQLLTRLSIWVRDQMALAQAPAADAKALEGQTKETVSLVQEHKHAETENSNDEGSVSEELRVPTTAASERYQEVDSDESDADSDEETCSSVEELEIFDKSTTETALNVCRDVDLTETSLRKSLQSLFGHSDFRDGQEWAVRRCMEQKRTLLVAPTSFGKSLCYALPAALLDGLCVVVSPLVSLMQDQLQQLPPRIPSATLSGTMSTSAMAARVDDVIRNRLKILFVSPERLASPSFRRLFRLRWNPETKSKERLCPTVSLFCIDEAHCMSQWGHNFRPSYLRLRSLIETIQPKSVLAMTATAGPVVVQDICRALSIPACPSHLESGEGGHQTEDGPRETGSDIQNEGVRIMKSDRDNIDVACLVMDTEEQRRSVLSSLLIPNTNMLKETRHPEPNVHETGISPGCLSAGSVIVYVWRKRDAEVVAEHLAASGVDGGVVVYHGGLDAAARSKAQTKFMRGRARVCVATVAFGLGINKPDVAAVVHLHLPNSPENYLQEIGRAGRDGRSAQAIALVMKEDVVIRHSLAHSDSISKSQIKVVLETLRGLVNDAVGELDENDSETDYTNPISVALPIDSYNSTIVGADCKLETIETILSLLEESSMQEPWLRIEGTISDMATVTLKRRSMEKLAKLEPVVNCILQCAKRIDVQSNETRNQNFAQQDPCHDESKRGRREFLSYSFGVYNFSITQCARRLGACAEPRHVYAALRRLQNTGELELVLQSSVVHLRVESCGIRLFRGDSGVPSLNELATALARQFTSNVACVANKVQSIHEILNQVADTSFEANGTSKSKSARLVLFQQLVHQYFVQEQKSQNPNHPTASNLPEMPKGFDDKLRRELSLDVEVVLRDMSVSKTDGGIALVKLNDPTCYDYTALAVTKFFHAIETPRAPYSSFSGNVLFGKWRDIRFNSLLGAVTNILDANT